MSSTMKIFSSVCGSCGSISIGASANKGTRIVTVKVLPKPSSLLTLISPPINLIN
ncbi:Uncharacterised protein [Vibrio cholerae]|nr:Uncharacterised protein [Vibrio cholerae]